MPGTDVDETAQQLAEDLTKVVEDAKSDVAESAAAEETKRLEIERLDRIESRLVAIENHSAPSAVTETAAAPVVTAGDTNTDALDEVKEAIADLGEKITKPVEDAAETVMGPVGDVADEAEEVVETLPKRTHALFKPLGIGRRRDD
jgi:hypothetical protein